MKGTELEEKIGFKMGRLTKLTLKHDQKKAERAAAKAKKKAEFDALSDEEKQALKKARALKIGGAIGGGLAVAGATAVGVMKIMTKGQTAEPDVVDVDYEEIPDTVDQEYPTEE